MLTRVGTAFLATISLASFPARDAAQLAAQRLTFSNPTATIGRTIPIGVSMGAQLLPDGSMLMGDFATTEIIKYKSDGSVAWRTGRKGQGPGEYRLLYRLCAWGDTNIAIYDRGTQEITTLNREGRYVWRKRLPFNFSQVDNIVCHPSGQLVISGAVQGEHAPYAIHVFSSDLKHLKSFGPVPHVNEAWVLDYWGVGGITLATNGHILFTRKLPYEIYRFAIDGTLISMLAGSHKFDAFPDEAFMRQTDGSRLRIGNSGVFVPYPSITYEIAGGLLVTTRFDQKKQRILDIYDSQGRIVATQIMGALWKGIQSIGVDGRTALVATEEDLEPMYHKVAILIGR